jgi:hypothetical protein
MSDSPTSSAPALVVYNPIQGGKTEVPQLPQVWVTIHQSATSASLMAGAVTYAVTKMAGTVTTYTVSKSVELSGTVLAEGAKLIAGQTAKTRVQYNTEVAAEKITVAGQAATNTLSMVTAAGAAAVAGATMMVGNVVGNLLYSTYKYLKPEQPSDYQQAVPVSVNNTDEYEFIICDVKTNSPQQQQHPQTDDSVLHSPLLPPMPQPKSRSSDK